MTCIRKTLYLDCNYALMVNNKSIIAKKEVEETGIPRHYSMIFTRENKIERVTHGVYLTLETFEDVMYTLQVKVLNKKYE